MASGHASGSGRALMAPTHAPVAIGARMQCHAMRGAAVGGARDDRAACDQVVRGGDRQGTAPPHRRRHGRGARMHCTRARVHPHAHLIPITYARTLTTSHAHADNHTAPRAHALLRARAYVQMGSIVEKVCEDVRARAMLEAADEADLLAVRSGTAYLVRVVVCACVCLCSCVRVCGFLCVSARGLRAARACRPQPMCRVHVCRVRRRLRFSGVAASPSSVRSSVCLFACLMMRVCVRIFYPSILRPAHRRRRSR